VGLSDIFGRLSPLGHSYSTAVDSK